MSPSFSARRRSLLGLLAGSCVSAPALAAPKPQFVIQTEASLAHCIALLQAALVAAGYAADFISAPYASEARNQHEIAAGRVHVNLLPASPSRLKMVRDGRVKMIPVPLERGLLGWRAPFVLRDRADALAPIRTLADLRQLTIGQGPSWWDVEIYRAAGITTREVQSWRDGQFAEQMRSGVIDLFPMGLEESLSYFLPHFRRHYPQLTLDESLLLRYPWYRFVWVTAHPDAQPLYQALAQGFDLICGNGVFESIWAETRRLPPDDAWQGRAAIHLDNPFYSQDIVPQRYRHLLLHPRIS